MDFVEQDRLDKLAEFANADPTEAHSLVPSSTSAFSPPTTQGPQYTYGAQRVEVYRDEEKILKRIRIMAAAAGEDWFYRFPVSKKVKDPKTGRIERVTDYIEGPSIKCCMNVARVYMNNELDTRVFDTGTHYLFYARFWDVENGFAVTRPFNQRKGQQTMRTDSGRQEDIVFQIGASKAIRNVIHNALEFFTTFGKDEAKKALVSTIGKNLEDYRKKIENRLKEMGIDLKRVEMLRGRALKDWTAPDAARTIAEIRAINDGMSTIDETYPVPGQETETVDAETGEVLENFANGSGQQSQTQQQPASSPTTGQTEANTAAAATSASDTTQPTLALDGEPTTEAEYIAHFRSWLPKVNNIDDAQTQWSDEKKVRKACKVTQATLDTLKAEFLAQMVTLRDQKS